MKLKVLSFNIHKGLNWNNTVPTLEKLKTFLVKENPDIVFLQEVVGENKIFSEKFADWMSNQLEFLADSIWSEYAYAKNAVYDQRHHGNVILSKFPIVKQEQVNISTNKLEQRGILYCEIDLKGQSLHCFNVHLNLTHFGRKKQYKEITEYVKSKVSESSALIVAGDFNDWNQKATSLLAKNLNILDAHKSIHQFYAKTFPSIYPLFSLDRIYTNFNRIHQAYTLCRTVLQQWHCGYKQVLQMHLN